MRLALKLNDIEQEHLQEVYDAAGVARDELPYTGEFDKLCQEFQDRTFKNAEPEQVYGALLKYVRSSTCASADTGDSALEPEQAKKLKVVLKREGKGRILPYSSEYESALKQFNAAAGMSLSAHDFWLAISRTQARSRRPPKRVAKKAVAEEEGEEEGE